MGHAGGRANVPLPPLMILLCFPRPLIPDSGLLCTVPHVAIAQKTLPSSLAWLCCWKCLCMGYQVAIQWLVYLWDVLHLHLVEEAGGQGGCPLGSHPPPLGKMTSWSSMSGSQFPTGFPQGSDGGSLRQWNQTDIHRCMPAQLKLVLA